MLSTLLLLPSPVRAGDDCRPEPITAHTPSGIAGCTLDGPTDGIASTWGGDVAAAQWCVYPWTDCGSATVTSHETGITITVSIGMFCDCYWETDRRLIDLTIEQVLSLGLDPAAGLFDVTVTPLAPLPDTAVTP
jgi:hypothetical protein